MTTKLSEHKVEIIVVAGIFILALGLRLWGISFGLPYEYHVDEVQYVRQAAQMGSSGLDPVWWNNPPFFKYMLLAEYGALYVLGHLLGWYSSVADFGGKLQIDPTMLYLLGRGTNTLLGALTVLVTYFIGARGYNRRVGLLAAFFLAVSFLAVRESHFAVNDTPVTFWISLVLLACVGIIRTKKLIWYTIGAVALGFGFATKYSAMAAIIPYTISHFLSIRGDKKRIEVKKLLSSYAVTVIAATLASPYFILRASKVWQDVYQALYLAGKYGFEGWQIDSAGGYVFYLKTLVWGLGWGLATLAILGVVFAVFRHRPIDIALFSLPLMMYLVMGMEKMYFARFLLPFIPVLIILASSFIDSLFAKLKSTGLRVQAGLALIAAVLVVQPLINSLRLDYLLSQADTRTIAKIWIEENIPANSKIAEDWHYHGVPLSTVDAPVAFSSRTYQVSFMDGKGLSDHRIEWYKSQGYNYLITSSNISSIPLSDPDQDRDRKAFYQFLDNHLEIIREFKPSSNNSELSFIFDEIYGPAIDLFQRENSGPTIKIYSLSQNTLTSIYYRQRIK